MSQFRCLLNAFEEASQAAVPSKAHYAEKRKAVLEYVEKLEAARPEERTIEQRWRDWVNDGDVTEDAVRAGAKVIAASPLIDAPKLSHNEWMGLSRSILEAAFAVSPRGTKP